MNTQPKLTVTASLPFAHELNRFGRRLTLSHYFICFLFFLLFAIGLLSPLAQSKSIYWGDISLYFYPMWQYTRSYFIAGKLPLWNPHILGGQPFVGNPQEGIFYPPAILLRYMPIWQYTSLLLIGHLVLAGMGAAYYVRRWLIPHHSLSDHSPHPVTDNSGHALILTSSLITGMTFMGSEYIISRVQFPTMVFTVAYLPIVLGLVDRILDLCASISETSSLKPTFTRSAIVPAIEPSNRASVEYALKRSLLIHSLVLAGVIALTLLAAHPQMAYLIALLTTLYLVTRTLDTLINHSGSRPRYEIHNLSVRFLSVRFLSVRFLSVRFLKHLLFSVLGATLLGLLLASIEIVPIVQLLSESPREELSATQVNRFYLEPAHLLRLIMPRFFGSPATGDYWGMGNAWEPSIFVGWVPLILSAVSLIRYRTKRASVVVLFWGAMLVISIWLALGVDGGLFWIAYKGIPGLKSFHDPARFLIYTTFGIAVLAGIGMQALIRYVRLTQSNIVSVLSIISVAAPLLLFAQDWNPVIDPKLLPKFVSDQSTKKAKSTQRIILPFHDRFWKHYVTDGYSDYSSMNPDNLARIGHTLLPNIQMGSTSDLASGYEPVPVSGSLALDALTTSVMRSGDPKIPMLLDLSGVDKIGLPPYIHISSPNIKEISKREVSKKEVSKREISKTEVSKKEISKKEISKTDVSKSVRSHSCTRDQTIEPKFKIHFNYYSRNTNFQAQGAFLVHRVSRVEGLRRVMAVVGSARFDPDDEVIIHSEVPIVADVIEFTDQTKITGRKDKTSRSVGKQRQPEQIQLVSHDATSSLWKIQHVYGAGMVVFCQTGYPGWKARVDGKPAVLYRVDGALMGVFIGNGDHEVMLNYVPETFQIGMFFTLTGLAVSVGIFVYWCGEYFDRNNR